MEIGVWLSRHASFGPRQRGRHASLVVKCSIDMPRIVGHATIDMPKSLTSIGKMKLVDSRHAYLSTTILGGLSILVGNIHHISDQSKASNSSNTPLEIYFRNKLPLVVSRLGN